MCWRAGHWAYCGENGHNAPTLKAAGIGHHESPILLGLSEWGKLLSWTVGLFPGAGRGEKRGAGKKEIDGVPPPRRDSCMYTPSLQQMNDF